jgi:hypothetical protein
MGIHDFVSYYGDDGTIREGVIAKKYSLSITLTDGKSYGVARIIDVRAPGTGSRTPVPMPVIPRGKRMA